MQKKNQKPKTSFVQSFMGIVVDSNDPEKRGRCKIKVFGLFDDLEVADIPWAFQSMDVSFGDGGGGGRFSTPKDGTVVCVQFDNGNYYAPEYKFIQEISPDLQKELEDSYEGFHSLIYDGVEKVKIFYSQKKGLMLEVDGNTINITNDNQIKIDSKDKISITSTNVVNVEAARINLGENAAESVVKGDTFKSLFDAHTHTGNLGAPTSPPIIPLTPNALSTKVKTE